MLIKNLKRMLMVVMLSSATTFVFADDAAPVYDADSMPPQFDGQSDMGPLPPPPSPSPQVQAERPYQPSSSSLTTDQRLGRMEQQINNMQRSSASSKVEQLQTEVQSLRGQVEELNHQLQQIQQLQTQLTQLRTMYTDMDKRLSKQATSAKNQQPLAPAAVDDQPASSDVAAATTTDTPSAPVPKTQKIAKATAKSTTSDTQPNVAEEQQTYQTAYDLIKAKKYNEAIAALQKMLEKYPSGQFAANAHYWLGELYNLTGKNDQAASEFLKIVKNFPDSPKIADAQFKLGMLYASQQKWPEAKSSYRKVVSNYPGTASAHLASEQLKQLKQAGH
jgi:tol-pal system protein YbgF